MAYQKTFLKLEKKDIVLVKPSKSTPCSILSLSTLDNIPDNDSLCQIVYVYRSTTSIHDSDSGSSDPDSLQPDPAHVMKEALSKALFYYYPLAGRLVKDDVDGKLRVKVNCHCAAEYGVPFLEATANCDLSSLHYLDVSDTEIAKNLVLDLPSRDKSSGYHQYPVLAIMVTKFQCGGFTIGMGLSHAVCDGFGASQFFQAIVELARGGIRSEPSVKPVWERERLVGSCITYKQPLQMQSQMDKLKASAAASPFLPTTVTKPCCFKVEGEMIRRLKYYLRMSSSSSLLKKVVESELSMNKEITTFEALAAYVWRSRARALKLSYDGKTMLTVLVGVRRKLLDYPLPDGYYGNATVDANVLLTVKELNERPLSEIVQLIKEAKNIAFTTDYIRNSINALETKQEDNFIVEGSGAVTVVTEWKHLGFMENVDFGGREAVNIIPAPCNTFGSVALCIFSSPNKFHDPSMSGGVRIFTSLPIAAIPKFREEMEALSFLY